MAKLYFVFAAMNAGKYLKDFSAFANKRKRGGRPLPQGFDIERINAAASRAQVVSAVDVH
jgi:hypothetical protein